MIIDITTWIQKVGSGSLASVTHSKPHHLTSTHRKSHQNHCFPRKESYYGGPHILLYIHSRFTINISLFFSGFCKDTLLFTEWTHVFLTWSTFTHSHSHDNTTPTHTVLLGIRRCADKNMHTHTQTHTHNRRAYRRSCFCTSGLNESQCRKWDVSYYVLRNKNNNNNNHNGATGKACLAVCSPHYYY